MLKALQKLMGDKPQEQMEQEQVEQIEAAIEEVAPEMSVEQQLGANLQDALAKIEAVGAELAEKNALLSEAQSKLAQYSELIAKAEAEAADAAQKAAMKVLDERKQMLASVMGSEAPTLEAEFSILKDLPEEAFNLVIASKKAAFEALEKSEMFREVGVSGEAEKPSSAEALNVSRFIKKGNKK